MAWARATVSVVGAMAVVGALGLATASDALGRTTDSDRSDPPTATGSGSVVATGTDPVLSRDGRWLAYATMNGGDTDDDRLDTLLVDLDGGPPRWISDLPDERLAEIDPGLGPFNVWPKAMSGDGSHVLLLARQASPLVGNQAWVYDRRTEELTRLPSSGQLTSEDPTAISDDGRWVLYRASTGNAVGTNVPNEVWRYDRSTGVAERMDGGGDELGRTAIPLGMSRDGRVVAWSEGHTVEGRRPVVVADTTHSLRWTTVIEPQSGVTLTDDGSALIETRQLAPGSFEIWRHDLVTDAAPRVASRRLVDSVAGWANGVSPVLDGQPTVAAGGLGPGWLVDLATGPSEHLPDLAVVGMPADGRFVLVAPTGGGAERPLTVRSRCHRGDPQVQVAGITAAGDGYQVVCTTGRSERFGADPVVPVPVPATASVVGAASSPAGGHWMATADGGVFTQPPAIFHGSAGGLPLRAPVVGIAPTPDGGGYWLAASDGGIFTYGNATFHGSAR